ncbi:prolyl 3-hydroxylase 3 [Clupea harengus]|uniref:procollagen-proline 3-dioxygenase n=1 Tax=Clupea harengus TaxID=7950 RepID=A0A6P3VP85_CLUHA|nr:prolyl 3-hydroxylase 3 [Clupea harengus]
MALRSKPLCVYVAQIIGVLFSLGFLASAAGSGISTGSATSLLPAYDPLYYLGVRAYFSEDWEKAAEHFEKSISIRQAILQTRRKCHDDCLFAGDDRLSYLETETGSLWDLYALDWVQRRAECARFCLGRAVTPAGQLPVSTDIDYEFGTRNAYNFLQLTYFKLGKMHKAAAAAHTFFVANPSHLEMRNNIEKYRRMDEVTDDAFMDREKELERHWEVYDSAVLAESSSDWKRAVEQWKDCVNVTLQHTEDCRAQCVVASKTLPEEDAPERTGGVYERAAALSLSLLACQQSCVTLVATRPGRVSAQEDLLPTQLEHLHIAQFKAGDLKGAIQTLRSLLLFYPSDADSLNNLQLYSETLGGDANAAGTEPSQEISRYVKRSLQEKKLLYFGMENLNFNFTDPDLWTPEDIVPESLRETWRAERERLSGMPTEEEEETDDSGFYAGGSVPLVGVTITMDDQALNGTNRVLLDGVLSQKECDAILQLASSATSATDSSRGRRSPYTPHEKFEGLTILRALKLSQDGFLNQSDVKLLHEVGERARTLLHAYFRSPSGLFFSFSHLVCRSPVPGHQEGRMDLSHPVHVDNCILEPETKQCWREAPAFTHRDMSGILYLNEDFEGGEFFFTKRDAKTVTARVQPKCGRLVGFSSGPVNPHGVTAVTSGRRCALPVWFTKEHHHRDMEREEAEALWTADGQSVLKEEKKDGEGAQPAARTGRSQASRGRSQREIRREEL